MLLLSYSNRRKVHDYTRNTYAMTDGLGDYLNI